MDSPFLKGVEFIQPEVTNASRCSIKCAVHYVLQPVVTHGPGCPNTETGDARTNVSPDAYKKNVTTEEAPIAHQ